MNKRGVISIYFTFIVLAIVIILIAAVFAPIGTLFTSEMYKAGEGIMLDANASIAGISDASVRDSIQGSIDSALDAQVNNIDINTKLFQYSWILVVSLVALVLFLFTRRLVETGSGLT